MNHTEDFLKEPTFNVLKEINEVYPEIVVLESDNVVYCLERQEYDKLRLLTDRVVVKNLEESKIDIAILEKTNTASEVMEFSKKYHSNYVTSKLLTRKWNLRLTEKETCVVLSKGTPDNVCVTHSVYYKLFKEGYIKTTTPCFMTAFSGKAAACSKSLDANGAPRRYHAVSYEKCIKWLQNSLELDTVFTDKLLVDVSDPACKFVESTLWDETESVDKKVYDLKRHLYSLVEEFPCTLAPDMMNPLKWSISSSDREVLAERVEDLHSAICRSNESPTCNRVIDTIFQEGVNGVDEVLYQFKREMENPELEFHLVGIPEGSKDAVIVECCNMYSVIGIKLFNLLCKLEDVKHGDPIMSKDSDRVMNCYTALENVRTIRKGSGVVDSQMIASPWDIDGLQKLYRTYKENFVKNRLLRVSYSHSTSFNDKVVVLCKGSDAVNVSMETALYLYDEGRISTKEYEAGYSEIYYAPCIDKKLLEKGTSEKYKTVSSSDCKDWQDDGKMPDGFTLYKAPSRSSILKGVVNSKGLIFSLENPGDVDSMIKNLSDAMGVNLPEAESKGLIMSLERPEDVEELLYNLEEQLQRSSEFLSERLIEHFGFNIPEDALSYLEENHKEYYVNSMKYEGTEVERAAIEGLRNK